MREMNYVPYRELEILDSGVYKDHKFTILSVGTHPCAYVECKIANLSGYEDKRLDTVSVHGGFTYYGDARWNPISVDEDMTTVYLGWDYAHYPDYLGYEELFSISDYFDQRDNGWVRFETKRWSTAEIFDEVKQVIEELTNIETNEHKEDNMNPEKYSDLAADLMIERAENNMLRERLKEAYKRIAELESENECDVQ